MKHHERERWMIWMGVAASLALGCGDQGADEPLELGDGDRPRLERVELSRLELKSADRPAMLHPVELALDLELEGDAVDTDVLVGLRADESELGCVLGALRAEHAEPGTSHLELGAEFYVNADCRGMIGRDDVELFAAFDPWGDTDYERAGTVIAEPVGLYDVVRGSVLDADACDACRVGTVLLDSPGIDAQLREVELSSSVAVLQLPKDEGQVEMPAVDTPHFQISSALRVTGLPKGQAPLEGETFMTHHIRPSTGAPGTEGLDDASLSWAPLWERRRGEDGEVQVNDRVLVDARGQTALQRASAVYIGDDVAARMGAGDWQGISEFELQTCVNTTVMQATYEGESAPRPNDCAILPVVVVQERVGPEGERELAVGDTLAGGAKARAAEVWRTGWSTTNTFLGEDYENGIDFETWLDINASTDAATTYGGRSVTSAGTWFEGGAQAGATVFNNPVPLLDARGTFIGYDSGGGELSAFVEVLEISIVDEAEPLSDGVWVSLGDIMPGGVSTTWASTYPLIGYSFDDGCGTVEAGLFLEGELGIDPDQTRTRVTQVANGVKLEGWVVPMASLHAVSSAEAAYDGFLSLSVGLSMMLEIFTISLPFFASETYKATSPAKLIFTENVSLWLNSLSGSIDFSFEYEYPCLDPIAGFVCEGDHSHNLVSWDGINDIWTLFEWSQTFEFGPGASFCDNFDGQVVQLYTSRDRYVDASPVLVVPVQVTEPSANTTLLVECSGEQVRLKKQFAPDYLTVDGDDVRFSIPPPPSMMDAEYTPIAQSDGSWVFQTVNGDYLVAKDGGNNWEIQLRNSINNHTKLSVSVVN